MPVAPHGPVASGWILAGVLLHLLNQVARARGWAYLVRRAAACHVRQRDVAAAWVAGAGAGGVISARGGDGVRLVLLSRAAPGRCGPLAGTLVAELAGESLVGAAVVVAAVGTGLVGAPVPPGVLPPAIAAVALAGGARLAFAHGRARRAAAGVWAGITCAGSTGAYLRRVAPWQLASRLLRGCAVACFARAFGLPATVPLVLLVLAAQSGGRLIPFGPAGLAASAALVAAGAAHASGGAVTAGALAGCYVTMTATLTVVGVVTGAAGALCLVDGRGLLQAVATARRALTSRWASRPAA